MQDLLYPLQKCGQGVGWAKANAFVLVTGDLWSGRSTIKVCLSFSSFSNFLNILLPYINMDYLNFFSHKKAMNTLMYYHLLKVFHMQEKGSSIIISLDCVCLHLIILIISPFSCFAVYQLMREISGSLTLHNARLNQNNNLKDTKMLFRAEKGCRVKR